MADRTVKTGGIWANGAVDPPEVPIAEVTYADSALDEETIETGWPFSKIVNSATFNEMMRRVTALLELLEKHGVLPYSVLTDYEPGAVVMGSGGLLHMCLLANGPSTTLRNPVSSSYWSDGSNLTDAHTLGNVDPKYYRGQNYGSTSEDPNLATYPVILSNHSNTPDSSKYWHITTTFYSTISASSNRGQIAVQYNGGNLVYARSCFSGSWTAWTRCDNAGVSIPLASSTVAGIIELATSTEAQAKLSSERALTPANLAALAATTSFAGLVELATSAESDGTSTSRAITPAGLMSLFNGTLSTSGWQLLPGGLILQWTTVIRTSSAQVVYWPTTFPSACRAAFVNLLRSSDADDNVYAHSYATNRCTVTSGTTGYSMTVFAIGC